MSEEWQMRQAAYLGALDANKEVNELKSQLAAYREKLEEAVEALEQIKQSHSEYWEDADGRPMNKMTEVVQKCSTDLRAFLKGEE
jgi:hypothetical protein